MAGNWLGGHRGRRSGGSRDPPHRHVREPADRHGLDPTIADVSRIEEVYHESDQRKYYVPCPHYGILQVLRWAQVKWPERTPAEAWYEFYAIGFPLLSLVIELDVSDWDRPVAKIVSQDIS